jgi:dTDP-4-dehydrorhamnose reductase
MLYSRVLITGANGLLGQELITRMSSLPIYDVLATGRDARPRFTQGSCGYTQLDIADPDAVHRIFQDFTPDVVINCAAMTQVDQCETERDACWKVNADAVETLARATKQFGGRLLQVSTDFVFDGADGPYAEGARPNPINYYGKSKLSGENAARLAGTEGWAIARTVLVYGTSEGDARSNIALWVINELSAGREIYVVTDQFRTPTYAPDLADGIERIVRYGKTGVYHLSGREFMSVFEFARTIARVFELDESLIKPTDSTRFTQPAARPPRTGFIILKAETELGFRPRPVASALAHLGRRLGLSVSTSL